MKRFFTFTIAIVMMVLILTGCSTKSDQERCADLYDNSAICVTTNDDTNVRSWHATDSTGENFIGKANGMVIVASGYYSWKDTNGYWYGFNAEDMPENAPRIFQKWKERHPDGIFWVCSGGGAVSYNVTLDGDYVGFDSSKITEVKADADVIWFTREYLASNFPVK